jgi:hypothetical protein
VITGRHVCPSLANTHPIELPSLRMLSVECFPPGVHFKTPALKRLYLDVLRTDSPTAEALLRGVCNLKTLSFDVNCTHNGQVIEWTPELDHLILSCLGAISLEAFQSLLQSLASHLTAYSLTKISVGNQELSYPLLNTSQSIMHMHILSTVIKSWKKHQFPKLRFVSVHVNNDHSEEITSAIADLMRAGADKGIEIDVNSNPLPTKLPFW